MKAIVLAGSRGIGKAIRDSLAPLASELVWTSRAGGADHEALDTGDLAAVHAFAKKHPRAEVLVLNTGGPPPTPFEQIDDAAWTAWFHQLFLSFVILLREIEIADGGYVFAITSHLIREPEVKMVLSSSLRLAFASVLKTLSQVHARRGVSFVNIAPGKVRTDRILELIARSGKTEQEYVAALPTGRLSKPEDIGAFVRFMVEQRIASLSGVTIDFDMGLGKSVI